MNQRWCMDKKPSKQNFIIYFKFKIYRNFEFSYNFPNYFYLGYMDSPRKNLWWTQFERCLRIITSWHISISPRLKKQRRNIIKIMEWMMMMPKVDYFTCTIFFFFFSYIFGHYWKATSLHTNFAHAYKIFHNVHICFCTCVLYFNLHKT
jgi:hypothetical protein